MTIVPDKHTLTLVLDDGSSLTVQVAAGATLLSPFVGRAGSPLDVGCRGGGCGVCRVRVLDGSCGWRKMSRRFVTAADAVAGYGLACRMTVTGDITVRPCPQALIPSRAAPVDGGGR